MDIDSDDPLPDPTEGGLGLYTDWKIRNEGRAWSGDEALERYGRTPEKIEMIGGKLFWTEEDRLTMLCLLLELVGVDRAVQMGEPEVWREAVAKLGSE